MMAVAQEEVRTSASNRAYWARQALFLDVPYLYLYPTGRTKLRAHIQLFCLEQTDRLCLILSLVYFFSC